MAGLTPATGARVQIRMLRRINISGAVIVLVCFFLPWVQVSCAGARDTLTGLDLARNDHVLLWLIPLLMLAVNYSYSSVLLLCAAFVSQYVGLLAERWYFFAEARHPQNLYYQGVS